MRVDAPGLVAAARRLITAVETLGGGMAHPPLAADAASIGAAERLSTAGAQLSAALGAHAAALIASVEQLTGAAMTYLDTDERNAAAIAALDETGGPAAVGGSAPPAPPLPADVRAPFPPPAGAVPEAISAAAHAGTPGAGEPFAGAWSHAAGAAREAAAAIRSTVRGLPESLDTPASTPAVSRHLLSFAAGLDTCADRAHRLVDQATAYAGNQMQARRDIPTPQQLVAAQQRIATIANANAASGGRYAVQLADAVAEKNRLGERAVSGYTGYHERTDAATAGADPGVGEQGSASEPPQPGGVGPVVGDPAAGDGWGLADPGPEALSSQAGGMGAVLPQLMPAVLGAAGGLLGAVMGAVTRVPESLLQAGTQAIGTATRGLSGPARPGLDPPDTAGLEGGGDPGQLGGGGDEATTTAAGGPAGLGVAPSTGAPPTPAIAPVGASTGAAAGPAAGAGGNLAGAPMMMPIGGPGGAGGPAGKGEAGRRHKVVVRDVAHTEDVTGRVDTDRLSAAASHRDRPAGDDPPDPPVPVVRRLVTRAPEEPS